jgi:glycosyltransferase involved in cell wall biosynthesis
MHAAYTRLTDRHGFASTAATMQFIRQVQSLKPDIVNLHNIHGYYLNVEVLMQTLQTMGVPVVWTFHDCWPITGHCAYPDVAECHRWQAACYGCPGKRDYPASIFVDNSQSNFMRKRELFSALPNLTIVAPCEWMADCVQHSFLSNKRVETIYNGVDIDVFKPASEEAIAELRCSLNLEGKRVVLGVANVWDRRKGLDYFMQLSHMLPNDSRIILIGLSDAQMKHLPATVIGIRHTDNVAQLTQYYSMADVLVNPTIGDNFPTVNIEALACGTPVVTYDTGGAPEAIDGTCGRVCKRGDVGGLVAAIEQLGQIDRRDIAVQCRLAAVRRFDSRARFHDYAKLFADITVGLR